MARLIELIRRRWSPLVRASPHAWLKLFTTAPTSSVEARVEGLLASRVFGGIGGALFAAIYSAAARR